MPEQTQVALCTAGFLVVAGVGGLAVRTLLESWTFRKAVSYSKWAVARWFVCQPFGHKWTGPYGGQTIGYYFECTRCHEVTNLMGSVAEGRRP